MDPVLGGAIVAGGSSLVSGIVGGLGQAQANKRGVKLAREQMRWNESMWNKQNAYNLPEAQIERMRQAGLHPGLMYSQGNVGNAGEVKGYQLPSIQNSLAPIGQGIAAAGSAVFDAYIKNEQIKQMQAQTELLKARAVKEANTTPSAQSWREWYEYQKQGQFQRNRGFQATAEWLEQRNKIKAPFWDATLFKAQAQVKSMAAQAAVDEARMIFYRDTNVEGSWNVLNREMGAKLGIIEKQARYLMEKYNALETLTPAQFQDIMKRVALADERIKFSKWQRSTGINGKTIVDSIMHLFKLGLNRRGRRY